MIFALIQAVWAGDLPLKGITYHVEVTGPLADIVVEQTFVNDSDHFIEATYVFPLSAEAAVDQMRIEVGQRVIEGEIHERGEAQQIYNTAKQNGQIAALTTEERPNIFTQHVANIGPGETLHVTLGIIQPVPRKDGAYELILPLVVAPRFIPDGVPDADLITPPMVVPGLGQDGIPDTEIRTDGSGLKVDIDIDVHASLPITRAESPTHPLDLAMDGEGLGASVYGVPATRDFVLRWWMASEQPQVGMLVHGEHALISFEPPQSSDYSERVPREVVWVLDTSGSMSGAPLGMAKRAMQEALAQMQADDSFALLSFSNAVNGPFSVPQAANSENIEIANNYIAALQASGGTMMVPALLAALALPVDPHRHRIVCFLTDGQIGNDDQVLKQIAAHPEVTFASIGIGSAPNRYILDGMAELGGGVSAYATLNEAPEAAMARLLDAMDRPVLTDISIDWGQWQVESAYPSRIPDLHIGSPVLVAAHLLGGEGPVRISGRLGEGSFTQTINPIFVEEGRPIVTTWARKHVAEVHRHKLQGLITDERTEILAVGLRWHILTNYTAFVAVEDQVVNPDGSLVPVQQLIDLPDGQEIRTQDLLSRIPAGRTYQTVVSATAGVVAPTSGGASANENTFMMDGVNVVDSITGTFSQNFNFDALENIASTETLPTLGGPLLTNPLGGLQPGNRLETRASLAAGFAKEGRTEGVSAEVEGPVIRDHLWLGSAFGLSAAQQGEISTETFPFSFKLVAQPSSVHRLTATVDADPMTATLSDQTSRYGGGVGAFDWQFFPSANLTLNTWVSGGHRSVRGDARDGVEAGATLKVYEVKFAGTHALEAGITADHLSYQDVIVVDTANLYTAFVADTWQYERLQLRPRLAGGLLSTDQTRLLPSPGLDIRLDVTGQERTQIRLSGARNWDVDGVLIGALDVDGRPSHRDGVTLSMDQTLFSNLILSVEGGTQIEHLQFVPLSDQVEIDAVAGSPWLDRQLWTVGLAANKRWSHRWTTQARYHLNFAPPPDAALLADPQAFWVPDFLDAYRRQSVDGQFSWELPTDPWTLSLGVLGAWASAVEAPAEGWWLGARSRLGAQATQKIPIRKGDIFVDLAVNWALRDTSTAILPLAVLAVESGAPSLEAQAPMQFHAGLRWTH